MDFLTKTIGRYLFAIPFFVFGILHFMNANAMAAMIPHWLPGAVFWVILTGLGLIAAAIAIIIKVWDYLAAILLGVMLLSFVLLIHLPGTLADPQAAMGQLLKDTSLAGAAWMYAGYVARSSPKAFIKSKP